MEDTFEKKLENKRSEENTKVLKAILSKISEDNLSDNKLLDAIDKQTNNLSLILHKEIPAPQVVVNTDNKELIAAFARLETTNLEIIANQKKIIELSSIKPKTLKIKRDQSGNMIDSVEIDWIKTK
jgi:hypothetical protein